MKVKILCGVSGSGKSTLTEKLLVENWEEASSMAICSADSYFMEGEDYNFNPAKLGEAHGWCGQYQYHGSRGCPVCRSGIGLWV